MKTYKFTKINTRNLSSLITNQFWTSSLDKMNDPFEDRFSGKLKELIDNFGVFSTSGEFNEKGENILTDPLMWAHYSENHSGIAIGLEFNGKNKPFKVEYLEKEEIDFVLNKYSQENNGGHTDFPKLAFKHKANFWKNENEYRIIFSKSNNYVKLEANIIEIVFGFRTKKEDEIVIWELFGDKMNYKKVINENGKLEIRSYEPIKKLKINPVMTLKV